MISSSLHLQYARALYKVAEKQQLEETLLHDLKALVKLYGHKTVQKLMIRISLADKKVQTKIIDETFGGKIHAYLVNLLKVLASRQQIRLLPKIQEVYSRVFHEAKGIDEVVVYSARVLTKDEEHALIKKLEAQKKKQSFENGSSFHKVSVHFEQNPALIGGVQIYEKGYLTDYSVQNYLHELQRHLLNQQTPFDN